MKADDAQDTQVTKEGIQRFLEYWLYGVLKTSDDLGTTGLLLRKIEEEAVSQFLKMGHVRLPRIPDAERALRTYIRAIDERGMMDHRNVTLRTEGDRMHLEIGIRCPYRTVCGWANREHRLHRCFRAIAFTEALRRSTGRLYEGTLDRFGLPCEITMSPSRIASHLPARPATPRRRRRPDGESSRRRARGKRGR